MTITAEVIKDSVSPSGGRITTYLLTYPRFIHSEFMTHRAFSRNASSSRAIPFEKQVQAIKEDMAKPLEFRKNQPGMQAAEPLTQREANVANYLWKEACRAALRHAEDLHILGVHKQYVNRLLEPYQHITVVCTATEFANFFALRYHTAAQPEICELAKLMWEAHEASVPHLRAPGEWHLPFVTEQEYMAAKHDEQLVQSLIRKSVACCARTSYNNHDSTKPTQDQNDFLYLRLLGAQPIHASPAEHQAMALSNNDDWYGNFRGWKQYRKTLEGENITEFTGPLGDKK